MISIVFLNFVKYDTRNSAAQDIVTVHSHPTLSESVMMATGTSRSVCIGDVWVAKIFS